MHAQDPGWIYFVGLAGYIKIGFATLPRARFSALQGACPLPMEFLGGYRALRKEEKELHKLWARARVRREWFTAVPELVEFIKARGADVPTQVEEARLETWRKRPHLLHTPAVGRGSTRGVALKPGRTIHELLAAGHQ